MESQLDPLRAARRADRTEPERRADLAGISSHDEHHERGNFSSPVLPEQSAASLLECVGGSTKSAEDISRKIRQDGVRHLLAGRAAGNLAEYSYGGNAFVWSLILGANSIRTNDVP